MQLKLRAWPVLGAMYGKTCDIIALPLLEGDRCLAISRVAGQC